MLRTLDPSEGLAIHELVGVDPSQATQVGADAAARHRRRRAGCRTRLRSGRHRRPRAARRHARRAPRRAARGHGPVRIGQVDADAHPGRPGQADERLGHDRRDRDLRSRRRSPDPRAPRAHRVRVPVLQPAADAHRRGERGAAAVDRRRAARPRLARGAAGGHRARRAAQAPPLRAVGWPAAARRARPGAGHAADDRVRRRADREPRLEDQRGDPRAAARPRPRRTARRS